MNKKYYKAFEEGLVCRGKQYQENTIFEEPEAEICKFGMHFCENPFDVLDYYPLVDEDGRFSNFAEVEPMSEIKTDDGKKYCTKKLKIGFKLSLKGFIDACIDFLLERSKENDNGNRSQLASSGNDSKLATSGDFSQLASSGDFSQLATSGDFSQLASSGNDSKLATSGDFSQLASSGDFSVIAGIGANNQAKAKIGCWITLAEWKSVNNVFVPICVKTEQVDGVRIKEDVYYQLVNGEFVEV